MSASARAVSSIIVLASLGLVSCRSRPEHRSDDDPASAAPSVTVTLRSAPEMPVPPLPGGAVDAAALVVRVQPSVVNVTSSENASRLRDGPLGLWPGDGKPPGKSLEEHFIRQSLGSGFIVDPRGYVVTNAHVVENAERVRVRLQDERELDATVRGRDLRLDIAVLELKDATGLVPVTLGSSRETRVGDYVIAIGNPFGLGNTVTAGIISAKSREIGAGPYDDFIQTDASINLGNSGGPLFNGRGEVVGINTAVAAAAQGIGFAIPSDALKDVLPQLIETGHVSRGRLGVAVRPVEEPMAAALGLDRPRGALVAEVQRGGPAAHAGIQGGDVITAIDGVKIAHASELARVVARHRPNTEVSVELVRDRKPRSIKVVLEVLEDRPPPGLEAPGPGPRR